MSFNWDEKDSRFYVESLRSSINKNYRPWAKLIAKDLEGRYESPILADIACGPGFLCTEIAKFDPDCRFVFADASETMTRIAEEESRTAGISAEIVTCPADKLAISDAHVDAIACKQYFHETDDPAAVISEFFRTLKSGGRAYLIDFDAEASKTAARAIRLFLRLKANKRISDWYWMNVSRGKPGSVMTEHVKSAGFTDVQLRDIGPNYFITATKP
jgi:ubiquinone/menaquinone biosynthesis C-methylase UbiE